MSSGSDSDSTSQSHALDAAGKDADTNAGSSAVGDPVNPCPVRDPTGPLWVRFDLTKEQAAQDPGSLRLQGDGYDSTLAIAGTFKANPEPDNTVDIVFQDVPINGSYTLTYIRDGNQVVLVESAPFSSLLDDSLPPADEDGADGPSEEQP